MRDLGSPQARLCGWSRFWLGLIAALAALSAAQTPPAQAGPPADNWQLTFQDEFNANGLNRAYWTPEWPLDINGACTTPSMVNQPGDGYLHLWVKEVGSSCRNDRGELLVRPTSAGSINSNPAGANKSPITSGFQYLYGYVEWRAYLPGAPTSAGVPNCPTGGCVANWPTFWSFSQGQLDELDVAEGRDGGMTCPHWHHWEGSAATHPQYGICNPNFGGGWHTYGLDWEPGGLAFFYDGQLVELISREGLPAAVQAVWPDDPQFLIASNQARRTFNDPYVMPGEVKVDYVRIWQHPPDVAATQATEVTEQTAKLSSSVNPRGSATSYYFQYGTTTSYGKAVPAVPGNLGSGTAPAYAWNNISGLTPGATYHFRVAATNGVGTTYSADQTFRTPSDVDHDGVLDWDDWCPTRVGVSSNHGCPPEGQQSSGGYYYPELDGVNMAYAQADGTLALKYIDDNQPGVWKIAQLPGGGVVGPVSTVHRANGEVLIFYRGTDSRIHMTWLKAAQWYTQTMSGLAGGPPSATERNNGDVHVAYKGADGAIYDLWYDNDGPGWRDQWLGGAPRGNPSVTTRSDNGEVHIFYRNLNGYVYDLWLSGNTWQDAYLGGVEGGDPRALYRPDADRSTSVFYRGKDGLIYDLWHDNTGWHNVAISGVTAAGTPNPIYSTKTGNIHVFYRTATGYLRDVWLNSQNNGWTDQQVGGSGLMIGSASPVNRTKNGDLHVFYVRSNGTLWDDVFNGSAWSESQLASGAMIDADSDEVTGSQDWCPTRAGVLDNYGCPPERQQNSAGYYFPKNDSVSMIYAQTNGSLALKYNDYGSGAGWKLAQLPGAPAVGPISSITRTNGDILAFYRSTDSKIHITWIDHNTSQWMDAGAMTGLAAGPPSATERNNGDMHVVYRGTDGAIHDLWFNNSAPKWIDQPLNALGVAVGEPSVTTRSDNGEVHIFYRRSGGVIYDLWLKGNTWTDSYLGGSAAGDPKAFYRPDADFSVSAFYRGTDGKVRDLWWDASGWHDVALGGTPAGDPVPAYSTKTGNVHVFYRSTTGYMRDMWLNSQTSVWTDVQVAGAGLMKGTASPVNRTKNGDLHVLYVRSNGTLYDAEYNGTAWVDSQLALGAAVPAN